MARQLLHFRSVRICTTIATGIEIGINNPQENRDTKNIANPKERSFSRRCWQETHCSSTLLGTPELLETDVGLESVGDISNGDCAGCKCSAALMSLGGKEEGMVMALAVHRKDGGLPSGNVAIYSRISIPRRLAASARTGTGRTPQKRMELEDLTQEGNVIAKLNALYLDGS